ALVAGLPATASVSRTGPHTTHTALAQSAVATSPVASGPCRRPAAPRLRPVDPRPCRAPAVEHSSSGPASSPPSPQTTGPGRAQSLLPKTPARARPPAPPPAPPAPAAGEDREARAPMGAPPIPATRPP